MRVLLMLIAAFGLTMASCSKREDASAGQKDEAATANPITAPVDYLGAVGKAKQVSERTIDAAAINQAIQLFYVQEDRFPKELNELVAKRYIPALPQAPAGTRFAYNPQNGEFKIVKQP
jgi:hypothetical protein